MNIGAVARACGVSERTIRHYEQIGLIPVARRDSGYRDYSDADVHRLHWPPPGVIVDGRINEAKYDELMEQQRLKDEAAAKKDGDGGGEPS